MNESFKGIVYSKIVYLLTLMTFQTFMSFCLMLDTKEDILTNFEEPNSRWSSLTSIVGKLISQQGPFLKKYYIIFNRWKKLQVWNDMSKKWQMFHFCVNYPLKYHNNISFLLCCRSRSVVRIHAIVRFEPSKINIFNKDCRRGGKDVTCMSAIVCLNITARTPIRASQEIGQF